MDHEKGILAMSIRRSALLGLLAAVSLTVGAAARAADDFDRRGGYLGLNAAYGIDLFSDDVVALAGFGAVPLDYANSWGLNARLGYRAFSWLAIEAQYEWMKGIDASVSGLPIGPIATYKPNTITGNLKLFLPVWRVQPYILAGIGVAIYDIDFITPLDILDTSSTGFAFRGGAGADIYLSKNWAINAEGTAVLNTSSFEINQAAVSAPTNLYYFSVSAGLTYRF